MIAQSLATAGVLVATLAVGGATGRGRPRVSIDAALAVSVALLFDPAIVLSTAVSRSSILNSRLLVPAIVLATVLLGNSLSFAIVRFRSQSRVQRGLLDYAVVPSLLMTGVVSGAWFAGLPSIASESALLAAACVIPLSLGYAVLALPFAAQTASRQPRGRPLAQERLASLLHDVGAVSLTILMVSLYPSAGLYAVGVVCLLLLVIQQSYVQYLKSRQSYRQVVEALSRAIDLLEGRRPNSTRGVAGLALRLARRMGLGSSAATSVYFATLLHSVGSLESERTTDRGGYARSAALIDGIEYLGDVRLLLAQLDELERVPLPSDSWRQAPGASILRVVADYQAVEQANQGTMDPQLVWMELASRHPEALVQALRDVQTENV